MWDFGNNLNWNLALRQTYLAQPHPELLNEHLPIPAITLSIDSHVLLIGASSSKAKPNWYLAGRASSRLLFSPSSTSDFLATVQSSSRYKIGLNRLNLIRFTDYDLTPYLLEIQIASWHQDMYLEVWKYSGDLGDVQTSLTRIEGKIDNLN